MTNTIKQISHHAREQILHKLNRAKEKRENGFTSLEPGKSVAVFPQPIDLLSTFQEELEKIGGFFHSFSGRESFVNQVEQLVSTNKWRHVWTFEPVLKAQLEDIVQVCDRSDVFMEMEVAFTYCEVLIARTGSVMVSSASPSGRQLNIFPPIHCVVAKKSQLVPFISDAIKVLKDKYKGEMPSHVSVITGASRTADIEKTLVMGAHGPKELHLFIDLEA